MLADSVGQDNIEGAKRLFRRALSILEESNLGSHLQAGTILVALADLLYQEVRTSQFSVPCVRRASGDCHLWFPFMQSWTLFVLLIV